MNDVTCVFESHNALGEGPVWDVGEQALYWVDIPRPGSSLHRWKPTTGEHNRWPLPEMATAFALREKGGVLTATPSGVKLFDPQTGNMTLFCQPEKDLPRNRSNDGKCDRKGRFWFGSMWNNLDEQGGDLPIEQNSGRLYRVDPDGSWREMDAGFGISNTFAWSPDNRTMYFGDTYSGLYAYDFDLESGTVSNRRDFCMVKEPGMCDGSTIDAQGYLWNARWDGGCLLRIAPDGTVDRVVELPVSRPTSCTFGGPNLDILYVTSASSGLTAEQRAAQPYAGGIFAVQTGVAGLPEPRFAG